ncbi:MAG: enhancer of mRNA decapping [Phylliscum demangeonii]|nr:MAG: enhancer of mRNA decapping [Phylliscum demangeonii]
MAANYLGREVLVQLSSPAGAHVQGLIAAIGDHGLTLRNVLFPETAVRLPEYHLKSAQIADLSLLGDAPPRLGEDSDGQDSAPSKPAPANGTGWRDESTARKENQPHPVRPPPATARVEPFVDPAIVSFNLRVDPGVHSVTVQRRRELEVTSTYGASGNGPMSTADAPAAFHHAALPGRHAPATEEVVGVPAKVANALPKAHAIDVGAIVDSFKEKEHHSQRIRIGGQRAPRVRPPISLREIEFQSEQAARREVEWNDGPDAEKGAERSVEPDVKHHAEEHAERDAERDPVRGTAVLAECQPDIDADGPIEQDAEEEGPENDEYERGLSYGKTRRGGRNRGRRQALQPIPFTGRTGRNPFESHSTFHRREHDGPGRHGTRARATRSFHRRPPRRRGPPADEADGWATGDATDIQGLGDFDFAGNLSKFDKRGMFNRLRAKDHTAQEDLLVNVNRRSALPGTAGGKNLHCTENVLDDAHAAGRWNSEAGETEAEERARTRRGSVPGTHRTISRQSTAGTSSRPGSFLLSSTHRPASAASARLRSPTNGRTSSAAAMRTARASPTGSTATITARSSMTALRLLSTGRTCPVVTPVQMLNVERVAESELGLTEDMMTENAGRGIAEIVLQIPRSHGRRPVASSRYERAMVVVLAGNNQSGMRAIAAARHLHNHGVRMLVCVVGLAREALLLDNVRRQLRAYQNSGGRVTHPDEFHEQLARMHASPELVIDGLLGMHVSYDDLRADDQAAVYDLIEWANGHQQQVLTVDVPAGLDATTGLVSTMDEETVYLRTRYIAAMGAPKAGVYQALASGVGAGWKVYIVDLGIGNVAWRKYGTKRRHGVEFAGSWVLEAAYQPAAE